MTRPGSLALALALAVALDATRPARADSPSPSPSPTSTSTSTSTSTETPTPTPTPPAESSEKPAQEPKSEEPPRKNTWVDVGHRFVEQRIFAPILRLDRFFSDERDVEREREQSFLRWRSEVRHAEDMSRPAFTTSVSANLRLPGLDERLRRLRIVIAGETRDAVSALFPRQPGTTTPTDNATEVDSTGRGGDAGLRFFLWDTVATHADLGGGVLLQLPPGVYGRLRFRWAFPVGPLFLTRTALIPFWRSDVKFGATGTLELDRPVKRLFLLRASASGTRSQRSNGLEWWTDLAAIVPLPPRSAAQVGVAWTGATAATAVTTDPVTGISRTVAVPDLARTRIYTRLRRDVYRRWLFMELEPEVAWPWSPERHRYSAWGIALRLEVQFQGKEAPRPPPPPPAPEPEDPPEEPPAAPGKT